MRREPSAREQAQATEKFDEIEKKDFDIFKRTAQADDNKQDNQNGDDVPPFFKRRRNN